MKPAMRHLLMVGRHGRDESAPSRLRGWLTVLQTPEDQLLEIYQAHRDEMLAEAEAAGFTPAAEAWLNGTTRDVQPDEDSARKAWSRTFCERWKY